MGKKWISDKTILKLVISILRKANMPKVYKINTKYQGVQTLTKEEVIQFLEDLAESIGNGDYAKVKRCNTCSHFSQSYCKNGRGYCYNLNAGYRNGRDFCYAWTPQTKEDKEFERSLNELRLQDERAGDGSEDSNQSN